MYHYKSNNIIVTLANFKPVDSKTLMNPCTPADQSINDINHSIQYCFYNICWFSDNIDRAVQYVDLENSNCFEVYCFTEICWSSVKYYDNRF